MPPALCLGTPVLRRKTLKMGNKVGMKAKINSSVYNPTLYIFISPPLSFVVNIGCKAHNNNNNNMHGLSATWPFM